MKKRFGILMFLVAMAALLAAVACGSSATAPVPTQPPPTDTPVKEPLPTEEPKTVEAPAPIEDSEVVAPDEPGGEYVLKITSGLPNGCAKFSEYKVEGDSNRFVVQVTNLVPAPGELIACTEIYRLHDGEVVLGRNLIAGETYSIDINDDFTHVFTARETGGIPMVEKESPIEKIEVVEADGEYLLTVVSRLPKGSSCSRFNGYKINRRFAEGIEITVSHIEVPADYLLPCTADLPVVSTEISLGSDFAEGQTYKVSVNGVEATFPRVVNTTSGESGSTEDAAAGGSTTGEDAPTGDSDLVEYATVLVEGPLEGSIILPPETAAGPYILKITSGLPSGCARFDHYFLSLEGNDYSIEVMNRVPNPSEPIACTMIYGYHEGQLTLGDGALNAGETYTVTINGELAHTFTAQ